MKKGFTLIELLIVVAIIAILAAIAIPNFLAAQVRAKVSRVKSELRMIGTGLESYYVDNNDYPLEYLFAPYPWPASDTRTFEYKRHEYAYKQLTTPIAYLTSIPVDPFKQGGRDGSSHLANPYYWYYNWQGRVIGNKPYGQLFDIVKSSNWAPWFSGEWAGIVISIGPSFKTFGASEGYGGFETYDPSNGTVSPGYINRLFPSGPQI